MREQVPRETLPRRRPHQGVLLDIDRDARGPQIILSRTHKGLLEKLFEQEVPEIYEGIVRIESLGPRAGRAREDRRRRRATATSIRSARASA